MGIEWTIRDGIPYSAPQLDREVRELVAVARGGKQQLRAIANRARIMGLEDRLGRVRTG